MKKINILYLSLCALSIACQSGPKGETRFDISIEGVDEVIIARLQPSETVYLDTLEVVENKVSYRFEHDSIGLFMVTGNEFRIPLFSNPGEVIEIDVSDEKNASGERLYRIKGNAETEHIQEINDLVSNASAYIDSLARALQVPREDGNFELRQQQMQNRFEEEVDRTRALLLKMIDEEPGRLSNLFIWPQSLGQFQLVSPSEYFEYYEKVDSALMEKYPNNAFAKNFNEQLPKIKKQIEQDQARQSKLESINAGMVAPEIALPDTSGTVRKLSDLRGNIVLVDFWAAWCRPCRAANPQLVSIYEKYKKHGFTVFSVSLDGLAQQPTPRQSWLQAIAADNLSWKHHVSDLNGWESVAADTYGIQGIPFAILVDREGKIMETHVSLSQLPERLDKAFGLK